MADEWWTFHICTICSGPLTGEPYAEFSATWRDRERVKGEVLTLCSQSCAEFVLAEQWLSYFCGEGKHDLPARKKGY